MPELVLLDSGVIIDVIQKKEGVHEHLKSLFRRAEDGKVYILVSSASRAELMCLKDFAAKGISQEEQNELIAKWFNSDYIVERAADRTICERAAELRRQVAKGLKGRTLTPIDSIILATAAEMGAGSIVTLDEGKSAKRNKHGDRPIGLTELNGFFGEGFPEITLPENHKGQGEFDYDEQE